MYHTLGEAAKATGKQKSTILDSIRKGRISAQKNDFGQWQIDPAELHRIYPPVSQNVQSEGGSVQVEREETNTTPPKIELLEEKIRFLEREIERIERSEADLKANRDNLLRKLDDEADERRKAAAEIRRLTLLITHKPDVQQPEPTLTEHPKKGFFKRLFGG